MILALGHEAGVGKDTFCSFIWDILREKKVKGLKLVREGFADRLYDLCHALYGWAGFQTRQYYMTNHAAKEIALPLLGRTPRDLLIKHGQAGRSVDTNCWLNATLKSTGHHLKIIPDLRFENEFTACEQLGALRVKIVNPRLPKSTREADVELHGMPDDRWTEIIVNGGTVQEFYEKAKVFTEEYLWPTLEKYMHGEMKPGDQPCLSAKAKSSTVEIGVGESQQQTPSCQLPGSK